MNNSRSLKALDAMNTLGVWMKGTTLCSELKAQDGMNHSGLWIIFMKMQ